ncbi:MAG: hypothetical protein KAJ09_05075 [Deltaproteobacteria bacterium]|nr:hypothetical protein [Deltaproteobacteria bacterium]
MSKKGKEKVVELKQSVTITPPNFGLAQLTLVGTAPLVLHRFFKKAEIMATHQAGSQQAKKGKKKDPRNFEAEYESAKHISEDGWAGVPAAAFRKGMISACRIIGFKMTLAKLGVFIKADGVEREDGQPLVRITKGKPEMNVSPVRNATGVIDLRARPMWRTWEIDVVIEFDADMFTLQDVVNLMSRVGSQVGIGEGRPDSKSSAGVGWGTFKVKGG